MRKFICLTASLFLISSFPLEVFAALSSTEGSSFILPEYSKTISLDFKDANLKDVLKLFSKQIGSNFILSDKVKAGEITVFLDKVPIEEAFEKILTANGLVYQYDPKANIFLIEPMGDKKELITRVYTLKNATVPSSKLTSTFTIAGGAAASAEEGVVGAIKSVISADGKVMTDPRTNSLIVMDIEESFPKIESILARLDVPIVQVFIQVEMIDTLKSALDSLGAKFSGDSVYSFGLSGRSYYFPFKNIPIDGKDVEGQTTYTKSSLTSDFKMALQFLMTRGDAKSVARPRIMTMDNETAQMLIETDELVGVTRTVDENNNATISPERMKTGVALTVTPQVDLLSGDVLMAIDAKFTQATDSAALSADQSFKDPETRGIKVKMKVHSKDTIMIAGMVRSTHSTTIVKIPILGDIPIIGRFFRSKDVDNKDRELVIVITPEIMTGGAVDLNSKNVALDIRGREMAGPDRSRAIDSALDRTGALNSFEHKR